MLMQSSMCVCFLAQNCKLALQAEQMLSCCCCCTQVVLPGLDVPTEECSCTQGGCLLLEAY